VGPYPEGDPAAMRAAAADLRRAASILGGAPSPSVDGWSSPAAGKVRTALTGAAGTARRVAGNLDACAASLDRAAVRLDTEQRMWLAAQTHGGNP
jgi:hypothetical protein